MEIQTKLTKCSEIGSSLVCTGVLSAHPFLSQVYYCLTVVTNLGQAKFELSLPPPRSFKNLNQSGVPSLLGLKLDASTTQKVSFRLFLGRKVAKSEHDKHEY